MRVWNQGGIRIFTKETSPSSAVKQVHIAAKSLWRLLQVGHSEGGQACWFWSRVAGPETGSLELIHQQLNDNLTGVVSAEVSASFHWRGRVQIQVIQPPRCVWMRLHEGRGLGGIPPAVVLWQSGSSEARWGRWRHTGWRKFMVQRWSAFTARQARGWGSTGNGHASLCLLQFAGGVSLCLIPVTGSEGTQTIIRRQVLQVVQSWPFIFVDVHARPWRLIAIVVHPWTPTYAGSTPDGQTLLQHSQAMVLNLVLDPRVISSAVWAHGIEKGRFSLAVKGIDQLWLTGGAARKGESWVRAPGAGVGGGVGADPPHGLAPSPLPVFTVHVEALLLRLWGHGLHQVRVGRHGFTLPPHIAGVPWHHSATGRRQSGRLWWKHGRLPQIKTVWQSINAACSSLGWKDVWGWRRADVTLRLCPQSVHVKRRKHLGVIPGFYALATIYHRLWSCSHRTMFLSFSPGWHCGLTVLVHGTAGCWAKIGRWQGWPQVT